MSARAPECQKIKNVGLDQYGAEPFEQQHFGTAGVEGVKEPQVMKTDKRVVQNIVGPIQMIAEFRALAPMDRPALEGWSWCRHKNL